MTTPITVPADSGLLTDIVSFGNITPLNIGAVDSATATLTTANKLLSGITTILGNSHKSVIGTTATGWGELYSQGNAGAWASAGSAGAPSGHGFLYDSTALEQQTIIAGIWQPSARIQATAGSAIGVLLVRFYVYNTGTYTAIGSVTYSSATYGTGTGDAISTVSLSSQAFNTGDKLYMDLWFNVTTNSLSTATDGLKISAQPSAGPPGSSHTGLITPGYVPTSVTLSISDSASGTDAVSLATITPSISDSATLSDPVSLATIAPSVSDSGSGSDAVSLATIAVPVPDSATLSEAVSLATIALSVSDAGTGSDQQSTFAQVPLADSALGADAVSLATIAVPVADSGAGAEIINTVEQFPVIDSGVLADAVRLQADPRYVTFITGP